MKKPDSKDRAYDHRHAVRQGKCSRVEAARRGQVRHGYSHTSLLQQARRLTSVRPAQRVWCTLSFAIYSILACRSVHAPGQAKNLIKPAPNDAVCCELQMALRRHSPLAIFLLFFVSFSYRSRVTKGGATSVLSVTTINPLRSACRGRSAAPSVLARLSQTTCSFPRVIVSISVKILLLFYFQFTRVAGTSSESHRSSCSLGPAPKRPAAQSFSVILNQNAQLSACCFRAARSTCVRGTAGDNRREALASCQQCRFVSAPV